MTVIYIDEVLGGFDIGYTKGTHSGKCTSFTCGEWGTDFPFITDEHQFRQQLNASMLSHDSSIYITGKETYVCDDTFDNVVAIVKKTLNDTNYRLQCECVIDGAELKRRTEAAKHPIKVLTTVKGEVKKVWPYLTADGRCAMRNMNQYHTSGGFLGIPQTMQPNHPSEVTQDLKMFDGDVYKEGTANYLNRPQSSLFVLPTIELPDAEVINMLQGNISNPNDTGLLAFFG
ncbi:hypothetical protein NVP1081O_134 [Vibrio phage 1.081.O._10N.286.52.C2]|nr:hypothetical protein NVP1081O_134 [Vibrio phage 1.081.O._10N.286.52.C2]